MDGMDEEGLVRIGFISVAKVSLVEEDKGAELFFEAGTFLLTLAGAEDGSFMVTPFKVLALNVEFDFKLI
nr:hypothetical protein [Tanacetum cinerariifolium]